MRLDGALGEHQLSGDLPVGQPFGQELGDLQLAVGERPGCGERPGLLQRAPACRAPGQLGGLVEVFALVSAADEVAVLAFATDIEPGGTFSIVGLVWRPGQATRIHDHISWCVFGVGAGIEHEELFDASLGLVGANDNRPGDVSGFAPPGDVHRVRNVGSTTAISIHIYGADVSRAGCSVRRYYE